MSDMNKWMLWGAWGLMAAVGSLSAWKISQTPQIEPGMVKLAKELSPDPRVPRMQAPPPVPIPKDPNCVVIPPTQPVTEWAGHLKTAYIAVAVPPPPGPVLILSLAKISSEAKVDLDGVTIGWELSTPTVKLEKHMNRIDTAPEKFT